MFRFTHISTSPIPSTLKISAGIYRVLSNIQNGIVSLEYFLWNWLVLIITIVITAISTTLFGQYSCTSGWQS
jgi:hypothetical protein